MKKTFILLPPSEGKVEGGHEKFSHLNDHSKELIEFLIKEIPNADIKQLEKSLKVKDSNLDKAIHLLKNIYEAKTLRAIDRFSGVMFKAVDYSSLDENQKKTFDNNILFIDGLFGIVKPNDLIPNYKLPIDAKINEIKIDKHWREKLEKEFEEIFTDSIVIDILPQAHRKVLSIPDSCEYYSITFSEIKNKKLKQAGHLSKQLKGELVRYLCNHEQLNRKILENFSHKEGYNYSREHSNNKSIIYLKN